MVQAGTQVCMVITIVWSVCVCACVFTCGSACLRSFCWDAEPTQPGNKQTLILPLSVLVLSRVRWRPTGGGHRVTVPTAMLIYIHVSKWLNITEQREKRSFLLILFYIFLIKGRHLVKSQQCRWWVWVCMKPSMVVTPFPHYAAQLFHEQHLQNKFGIQICWGWSNKTKMLSLFLPRTKQQREEEQGGKKISISPFWMHRISYPAGSKLHFIDFVHLISQSVFNWNRKHGRANWLGSTRLSQRNRNRAFRPFSSSFAPTLTHTHTHRREG